MTFEEKKKLHDQQVQDNVEKAKDPSGYCTYLSEVSPFDKEVSIYAARKIGRSHVKDGKPCQDYCMTQAVSKGHIFVVSDGVSACARSDRGSQFACEAAIEAVRQADAATGSEQAFVDALCAMPFRKTLINHWIGLISKDIALVDNKPNASLPDLQLYGATLSLAILTENRIVTLNLGDGQILLFNPSDAMRVRWHLPKEDSATAALCTPTCYEDSFIIHEHNRHDYSGILLTTDGIYDNLPTYNSFYAYARQITERFEANKEPLQPFCFIEATSERTRWIDFNANMTHDDCSIILVVDHRPISASISEMFQKLNQEYRITEMNARADALTLYTTVREGSRYLALTQHIRPETMEQTRETAETLELTTANILKPIRQWEESEFAVALYDFANSYTPNQLFALGKLLEKRESKYGLNASSFPFRVCQALQRCDKELRKKGYCLNDNARFLAFLNKDGLALMPEAISALDDAGDVKLLWQLFENQIGSLTCNDSQGNTLTRPLFSCGFNITGNQILNPFQTTPENLCYLQRTSTNERLLVNSGSIAWKLDNNAEVQPGESVALTDKLSFQIPGAVQNQTITVTFHERI